MRYMSNLGAQNTAQLATLVLIVLQRKLAAQNY